MTLPGPDGLDARVAAGEISMAEYWRLRAAAVRPGLDRQEHSIHDMHRVRPGSDAGPVPRQPAPPATFPHVARSDHDPGLVPPPPPAHGGPQPWVRLPLDRPSAEAAGHRPDSRRRRRRRKP